MRVGVEVGGTFTDLVAVEGGRVVVTKVPSTPKSPDIGAFPVVELRPETPSGLQPHYPTSVKFPDQSARGTCFKRPRESAGVFLVRRCELSALRQ